MQDSKQEELIKDFSALGDWTEKYEYIIEKGREMQAYPQEYQTPDYVLTGCQSHLWLYPSFEGGKLRFYAHSDALISKGLAALLLHIVNDRSPQDILDLSIYFFEKADLYRFLSMQRANGLLALIDRIRLHASQYVSSTEPAPVCSDKEKEVVEALKLVFDPEIPVNIYDLGLIYQVKVDADDNVHVLMTLTAPGCPAVDMILSQIETKVGALPWTKEVDIEITFEPPWDKDRMSTEAKLELGFL